MIRLVIMNNSVRLLCFRGLLHLDASIFGREFQMTNSNPTSLKSKLFTEPYAYEFMSSELLQFNSMKFAGDLSHGQKLKIYGFVAVRDDIDHLRNYIFNISQDCAQEISQDSRDLSLITPARGISTAFDVIVEYSLKVIKVGCDVSEDDDELIDGCFRFKEIGWRRDVFLHKVRLFSLLGPFDIRFSFLRYAVEATIEVKVKRAAAVGYRLSSVIAVTCGFRDEIVLMKHGSVSVPFPPLGVVREKDGVLSPSVVAVASAVMAVELGCVLKLKFEVTREEESGCRLEGQNYHELHFTASRYKHTKGAVVMGRMFKVVAKVTWSTMGRRFLPLLYSKRLVGNPDGPCSISED